MFFKGNAAKIFFSPEKRDLVLDLYKTETDRERSGLRTLLQNFNIILRILGSRESIRTQEFGEFCLDTNLLFVDLFPWMEVTPSIHRFLAHGAQIIALNDGKGLGQLSEAPLESTHKVLRKVRLNLSRMTCLSDNLDDTFGRLWMHASPQIRSQKPPQKHRISKSNRNVNDDDELLNYFIQDS